MEETNELLELIDREIAALDADVSAIDEEREAAKAVLAEVDGRVRAVQAKRKKLERMRSLAVDEPVETHHCDTCDRDFATAGGLNTHRARMHKKAKPTSAERPTPPRNIPPGARRKCPECDYSTTNTASMQRHQTNNGHRGEPLYAA